MPSQSPFPPVAAQPDFPAQEHRVLELWRERRTFDRLREQNRDGPTWSFLDGPITANNPMAVHHAWGRTYKDLYQRFRAMLGHDQRWQNGFDCQGLWVEVEAERELGFTSKRDIEALGIAEFVNLCKRRVLHYAAMQTEQSIRLGMWMDWNDPDELRRLAQLLEEDPARVITVEGPRGPVTDTVEMIVGRLGMPELGGSYFTFSNENNDLIWGFLAECHRRGWLYKGHDSMPWCARCGTGISQMEMNEGYQDRDDPGLTVAFPLRERPGESLLVWTTTPWTLAANVAAAVGPELTYLLVRQGERRFWIGKGTVAQILEGAFEVLEEREGSDLVGWTYDGPFDELPAVQQIFEPWKDADGSSPFIHRVVPWSEVGEVEGTGIVHIAPGAGAEDYQLGKALGLPAIGPLDESGQYLPGFGWLSGMDAREATEPIVADLRTKGRFYRLETYRHRYPHCWRCGTPLVFRLVDEWFISMGPVYDQPRETLTREQVDASLRYQIMEVVDRIRWIPGFGYERELDWLLNMHDWMISKKRYYGLTLPIYPCPACGTVDVIGGRDELRERAVEGWEVFEGHTPHRPWVDAVKIACSGCGSPVERIRDVGNPWLDAGIVSFSTLHYREEPEYWQRWFPADFITESFPGQFRNWFYALLAMSTVLRREEPFRTILGYALLVDEEGRPMHKSWGNAIDFNEAAETIGVDVMRWMFAQQRPEENMRFGYHLADAARRELIVLWNVFSFFATYARLAGWTPGSLAGERPVAEAGARGLLDRWILSRASRLAAETRADLEEYDARAAATRISTFIEELSTWYLRRSRRRFSRAEDPADRGVAFTTLHRVLADLACILAPILPFLAEELHQGLVAAADREALDSVHLTRWPDAALAGARDDPLEAAMAVVMRAVELGRSIRSRANLRVRQPLTRLWLALPVSAFEAVSEADRSGLLEVLAEELNVRSVELIGDESELVERRVRPLLPLLGQRGRGAQIPAIMAAARANEVEFLPGGRARLGGVELAADEIEIQAAPLPGMAIEHDQGIVVALDTTLTDDLRAEGDARELQRAVQELRRQAELALDDRIELWLDAEDGLFDRLQPHLAAVAAATLADRVERGGPPSEASGLATADLPLDGGTARVALRRRQATG
jgi:isoleucyl-tRNA synthetase